MRVKLYPKYRDSGIVWLGKIPEHWEPRRLMYSLCRNDGGAWGDEPDGINDTVVLRSTEQTVDGFWRLDDPAMRRLSTVEKQNTYLEQGDLIITKSSGSASHIGKTSIVNDQVALLKPSFSNFMQRLRCGKGTFSKFVWFCLNNPIAREQFGYLSNTTTGLANLTAGTIGDIWLAFPPDIEQLTIAAFLDRETARIDQLIAKKERQIELLQEKRSALISHAVTKGLNPKVKMKDSGIEWLGEIPEHWEVKKVKHVFRNLDYRRIPLSGEERSYMQKTYPYYGASGVIDAVENYLFDEPLLLVAEDGANLYSRSTPLAFIAEGKYWVNNHAHILMPLNGPIRYWEGVMQIFDYTPLISGAAQPKLTAENLANIDLPCPPVSEQDTIVDFLSKVQDEINTIRTKVEKSVDLLHEYRTVLISAAVTGKIDVREEAV